MSGEVFAAMPEVLRFQLAEKVSDRSMVGIDRPARERLRSSDAPFSAGHVRARVLAQAAEAQGARPPAAVCEVRRRRTPATLPPPLHPTPRHPPWPPLLTQTPRKHARPRMPRAGSSAPTTCSRAPTCASRAPRRTACGC